MNVTINPRKQTIGEVCSETLEIFRRLMKTGPGETVTYRELSVIAGGDVQLGKHYMLRAARKSCLAEGVVFGTVRGVGVRLLQGAEIITEVEGIPAKVRRIVKIGSRKVAAITDRASLTPDQMTKLDTMTCNLGALALVTKASSIRQVEQAVRETKSAPPSEEILALFQRGEGPGT